MTPRRAAFWRLPGAVLALRVLSVILGIVGSLFALMVASAVTILSDCSGGFFSYCTDYRGFALIAQWLCAIVAFTAPLTGGIASCWRREWWWLPAGLVIAAVAAWLTFPLEASQSYY